MFTSFQVVITSTKEAGGLLVFRQDCIKTTERILTDTWMEDGSQPRMIPITTGMYLDKETDCGFFISRFLNIARYDVFQHSCSFPRDLLMDVHDKDWQI